MILSREIYPGATVETEWAYTEHDAGWSVSLRSWCSHLFFGPVDADFRDLAQAAVARIRSSKHAERVTVDVPWERP